MPFFKTYAWLTRPESQSGLPSRGFFLPSPRVVDVDLIRAAFSQPKLLIRYRGLTRCRLEAARFVQRVEAPSRSRALHPQQHVCVIGAHPDAQLCSVGPPYRECCLGGFAEPQVRSATA